MIDWTPDRSRSLYAVEQWSEGYFDVSDDGLLQVLPAGRSGPRVALTEAVDLARESGLRFPLLLRFPDILKSRVAALKEAFAAALEEHDYPAGYTPVYPIKVNQQATVVRTLSGEASTGLEAGSKPELITAIALSKPGGTVICNGYKDAQYIRLALAGQRLGLNVVLVIEKAGEWPLILREARAMNLEARVGVRLRLASLGAGNWQNTGGERAKFGLGASQLLELLDAMEQAGCLDWLDLLHFHMGSQISNLRDIQRGVREAGRYLTELHGRGVSVGFLDIGGGLGVDYEGARSRSWCSMNYSLAQYASAIVQGIGDLCRERGLPMPHLLSESGRALTAHHAVLVTNVTAREAVPENDRSPESADHPVLAGLAGILADCGRREPEECCLEAEHFLDEGRNLFLYGDMSLTERAQLEPMYFSILRAVRGELDPASRRHRELIDRIDYKLSEKYFINLSIFQSLPDIWAINQVFPICPLQRLDQRPDRRAVLEDLTCDSDGRIDQYVEAGSLEPTLPVHSFDAGSDPYLLGFFMVGAYQEILGDMHNLFGDTDSADVVLEDAGIGLANARSGDSADALLDYVGYQPKELMAACRARVTAAGLDPEEAASLERLLGEGLAAYTYLSTA